MSKNKEIQKLKSDRQQLENLMALISSPLTGKWETIIAACKLVLYGIFYYVRIKIDDKIDKIEKDINQQNANNDHQDTVDEY